MFLQVTNQTPEDLLATLRQDAVRAVRVDLAMRALVAARTPRGDTGKNQEELHAPPRRWAWRRTLLRENLRNSWDASSVSAPRSARPTNEAREATCFGLQRESLEGARVRGVLCLTPYLDALCRPIPNEPHLLLEVIQELAFQVLGQILQRPSQLAIRRVEHRHHHLLLPHQDLPVPRSDRSSARSRSCGTRPSASGRSPTSTSATCSRWGPSSPSSTSSASRSGWPSGSGSGSILFVAGAGVLYLCRILGLRGPGPGRRRAGLHALPVLPPVRRADLGDPAALGGPALHGGPHHRGPAPGRVARPALFALVVAWSAASTPRPSSTSASPRSSGSSTPWSCCARRPGATPSAAALRIGVLTLGACLWWMAGLEVEAAYGVNVLKYTETVPSTSATSNAVRGLPGPRVLVLLRQRPPRPVDQRGRPLHPGHLAAGHLVRRARSGLRSAAAFVRWRERAFFLVLLFVGLVLSVGPFPFTDPTPSAACSSRS